MDVYTAVLIEFSLPLSKIMNKNGDWFRESRFGMWETGIQTKSPISIGWLLFLTKSTNTGILKWKSPNLSAISQWPMTKDDILACKGKLPKRIR